MGTPIGKHPIHGRWEQLASIDRDQINRWFDLLYGEYPDANLGIFPGAIAALGS